jgi:glyoxylase-like metal-dependent hydrolase (beta-lactamase superfamily II)
LANAASKRFVHARIASEEVAPGIERLRLSSRLTRWQRFEATPYLVSGLLVDTGFAYVRELVLAHLAQRRVSAICCTHHHEDHAGNAGAVARQHDCPIYLHHPEARWEEGVGRMPAYRRLWWGRAEPYVPQEPPEELRVGERVWRVIPTPGHSQTHVALHEARTGTVFSGDLILSAGATAVMRQEDPYALMRSLRRVAALGPELLLTGHGGVVHEAQRWLYTKAARVEEAAEQAVVLHERGLRPDEIVARVFAGGRVRDFWYWAITAGEYSRENFVRAAIAHRPAA